MSVYFDDLIREGRDTDAMRLFARTYYDNGKIGHMRMTLLVRVADEHDALKAELLLLRKVADVARDVCEELEGHGLYCLGPLRQALAELEESK